MKLLLEVTCSKIKANEANVLKIEYKVTKFGKPSKTCSILLDIPKARGDLPRDLMRFTFAAESGSNITLKETEVFNDKRESIECEETEFFISESYMPADADKLSVRKIGVIPQDDHTL